MDKPSKFRLCESSNWDYEDRDKERRRRQSRHERIGEDGYDEKGSIQSDGGHKVYKGRVSRLMDTGCFVQLTDDDFRFGGKEGLVHVSEMMNMVTTRRSIRNANDVVKRDQEVYVKVISMNGQKLRLSMRDVDQNTGKDLLLPLEKKKSGDDDDDDDDDYGLRANPVSNTGRPMTRFGLSGIRITDEEEGDDKYNMPSRRRPPLKKRMSSPEMWEAKQLIASGVLSVKEYPIYDEEGDGMMMYQEEEDGAEEELEIELNEDEPAFLQGQNRRYSVNMSPVKIFKNPEGSLSCAAALQSALIKERREVRQAQQRTMLDSIPKDLNRPWEDPMPETGERHLA